MRSIKSYALVCTILEINFILGSSFVSCVKFDISTHVLDTSEGRPAPDIPVSLHKLKEANQWIDIGKGKTTANGRFENFVSDTEGYTAATYKLRFDVAQYYASASKSTMYPFIDIVFNIDNPEEHYHVPLLLSAYGYTTYRGS